MINFLINHPSSCECDQCRYFGGIKELARVYSAEEFSDKSLRKIWVWLKCKLGRGSCHLSDLDFISDPTAPLLSDVVKCSADSIVFEETLEKIPKYLFLKDILLP